MSYFILLFYSVNFIISLFFYIYIFLVYWTQANLFKTPLCDSSYSRKGEKGSITDMHPTRRERYNNRRQIEIGVNYLLSHVLFDILSCLVGYMNLLWYLQSQSCRHPPPFHWSDWLLAETDWFTKYRKEVLRRRRPKKNPMFCQIVVIWRSMGECRLLTRLYIL